MAERALGRVAENAVCFKVACGPLIDPWQHGRSLLLGDKTLESRCLPSRLTDTNKLDSRQKSAFIYKPCVGSVIQISFAGTAVCLFVCRKSERWKVSTAKTTHASLA